MPAIYDMAAHYAREQQIFGAATPYYGWLYPPIFLLVAVSAGAAALSDRADRLAGLELRALSSGHRRDPAAGRGENRAIARLWLPVAAAFPAVFINLGHGQNGFLTAGLLAAALVALPRRPILSGILFGLLAYKPQFGLLIPVALLAAGQWRTMVAAGLTVVALAGLATMAFGSDIWWAFAASTETSRKLLLEQGDVGFEKLQSVFAAIRLWGGSVSLAYLVQGAASITAIGGVAWMWRSIGRSRSEGGAVDDRDLARLAPRARLRPHHPRTRDGVPGCLLVASNAVSGISTSACWRPPGSRRCRARHRRRNRHSARPDRDRGAVCADDAPRDARPRRVAIVSPGIAQA